jgi:uncharacterized cupin superfamily protein
VVTLNIKKEMGCHLVLNWLCTSMLNLPYKRRIAMKVLRLTAATFVFSLSTAIANDSPQISLVDSAIPTEVLMAKPGTYLGEKFTFEETHSGDVRVQVGVWEAGAGKMHINNFPFTEYVLMISGSVIVTEKNGALNAFVAGDTFVIPKGWTGTWDIQTRMKKQIVRIGSAKL